MKQALVTGANGHIGSNLVRDLLQHGYTVVAGVRADADVRGLAGVDVRRVPGDVLDEAAMAAAVTGVDLVFHLGAPYAVWAKDPKSIIEPAVRGTEIVLRAAKAAGVRRVVVTSSCNAVGFTQGAPLDETTWNERISSPYLRAKGEQERKAHSLAKELDLDVVTVLPTAVLGPYDYRKTPTSAPFVDALRCSGPVPFPTNLVDVRDVARGHVLAAEKGRRGERYLLGGDNVDVATLATIIERLTGKRPTEGLPPAWVLRTVAVVAEAVSAISGKAPLITRAVLDDVAGGVPLFDIGKAREELGYRPRPAAEVIEATLRWAEEMGWLPKRSAARTAPAAQAL